MPFLCANSSRRFICIVWIEAGDEFIQVTSKGKFKTKQAGYDWGILECDFRKTQTGTNHTCQCHEE